MGPRTTVSKAQVKIHSRHFQVYEIRLRITAEFGGLRYLVYNYPGSFFLFSIVFNGAILVWVMFGIVTGILIHGMVE